jgi:hypothetical protein
VDLYQQQWREPRHRLPPQATYHGVDGYLAKKQDLDEAVRLNLHPMIKLRCDADCRFLSPGPHSKCRGARRKYGGKVNVQDLRLFASLGIRAEADYLQLYTAVVWHVTLKRKLRPVVVVKRKVPAKPRSIVLASTELALDGRKLVELYGAGCQIAFLCRDSKQVTGLSDCQARAKAALDVHCNAASVTLNVARTEQLVAQTGASRQVFAMTRWKQR